MEYPAALLTYVFTEFPYILSASVRICEPKNPSLFYIWNCNSKLLNEKTSLGIAIWYFQYP